MPELKFNTSEYKMKDVLTDRWKENGTVYYIFDEIFGEIITISKDTAVICAKGFTGLISDYLQQGIFVMA